MGEETNTNWIVYLLECSDKTLYCGITNDLEKRIIAHNEGKGAKYTRGRCPVSVIQTSRLLSRSDALRLEKEVKGKPRQKKISFLAKY